MARVIIDRGGSDLAVDVVVSEKHTEQVELTKHPIEQGANPTDHARVLPVRYQVEGLFTNTPLSQVDRDARGVVADASSTGAPGAAGYSQQALGALRKLKDDRRTVALETTLRSYSNMVLVSLEVPRDSKTTDAVRFTAAFEEVRFVASEVARATVLNRPKRKPTKKVDQTKKQGADASEQRRSLLKKFSDWTGVTTPGSGVAP